MCFSLMDPSGSGSGPYRSLDRFGQLCCVLAALQVVCNLFGRQGPRWCVGLE
jgi:hypothetical protein